MQNTNETTQPDAIPSEVFPSIAETKQLRKELDESLQNLKKAELNRRSRERSLAVTKLQEAIMWLGMDLKAISDAETAPRISPYLCGTCENPTPYPLTSKVCPKCGGDVGANHGPKDNPAFKTAQQAASPYPQSYNPASPKIEPTADGLKL